MRSIAISVSSLSRLQHFPFVGLGRLSAECVAVAASASALLAISQSESDPSSWKNALVQDCFEPLDELCVSIADAVATITNLRGLDPACGSTEGMQWVCEQLCGRPNVRRRLRHRSAQLGTMGQHIVRDLSSTRTVLQANCSRRQCSLDPKSLAVLDASKEQLRVGGCEPSAEGLEWVNRLALALDLVFVCARSFGSRGQQQFEAASECFAFADPNPDPAAIDDTVRIVFQMPRDVAAWTGTTYRSE